MTPEPLEADRAPASPGELFRVFTLLALQGFGGVLPVAQRELVERQRWLSRAQFLEMLSIGQVLPGPNVCNVALMIGDRFFGWRGAAAALGGILAAPLVLVLLLAVLYAQFAAHPVVAGALRGMGAVAAGLIFAMAFKLGGLLKGNPMGGLVAAIFVALVALCIGWLRWPLVAVVFGLAPPAIAAAWWRLRR